MGLSPATNNQGLLLSFFAYCCLSLIQDPRVRGYRSKGVAKQKHLSSMAPFWSHFAVVLRIFFATSRCTKMFKNVFVVFMCFWLFLVVFMCFWTWWGEDFQNDLRLVFLNRSISKSPSKLKILWSKKSLILMVICWYSYFKKLGGGHSENPPPTRSKNT